MAAEIAQEIVSQSSNLQDRVVELEDQVSLLKSRLDALEGGKKPHEDWVFSAPDISTEELEEMGYDEDAVEEMGCVLGDMKKTTNKLRWGACDKIDIGDNCCSQMLEYHERLLPHWREFCDGLCYLKDDDELKSFDIANVELPNHIVSMILKALRGKKLTIDSIRFEYNNFKGNYGVELASWLLNHSTASSFCYEGDKIYYEFEFRPLINAMTKHKSLRRVTMNFCSRIKAEDAGKAAYDMLCSILESNKELIRVHFGSMCLEILNDASRLIDALKGCSELVHLDLSNNSSVGRWGGRDARNEIDPKRWGSRVFSEVLKTNPNLKVRIGDFNANYQIGVRD